MIIICRYEKSKSITGNSHFPVMLNEVINICSPANGGLFIDCTFGGGGYSKKILSYSNTKVIALDRDNFILNFAKQLEKNIQKTFFSPKNLAM